MIIKYFNSMKKHQNRLDELKTEIENISLKMTILKQKLRDVVSKSTSYEKAIIDNVSKNSNNLLAVLNAYPFLQANSVFMNDFKELSKLENELQNKLSQYNAIIKLYNDNVNNFPEMLLAWVFRFKKKNYARRT